MTEPASAVTFDDLVTAATVGLARRPLAITGLDGPAADYASALGGHDQAAALLDAAALMTVAGRAGFQPGSAVAGPPPVSAGGAPELSPRAERALRQLGGAQLAPGFSAGDKELLADLLTAAADAGYVASAPLLPDLLDAAVRTAALRPAVAALLGARGAWLAGFRPDWRRVLGDMSTKPAAGPVTARPTVGPETDPEVWRTGGRADRHAYLTARRDHDPDAGRELLAADWGRLPADERATLLAVLARGLSTADEEFLDAALDDRTESVRGVARRLLTRLPAARFSQRAIERAATVLRLERHGLGRRLAASRPADPDAAAVRDGISARPPSPAIGVSAWLLTQLVAAVPLAAWNAVLGLAPGELSPPDIVGLPVAPDLGLELRAGWRLATVGQRSSEWAESLLAAGDPADGGGRPPAAWPDDQRLAAALTPDRRAARAAARLAVTSLNASPPAANQVIAEVGGAVIPWPGELADGVLNVLGRAAPLTVLPRLPRGLLTLAARGLPATVGRDYAAELTRIADVRPQTWTPLVRKTAETILLRRAFLEEIH